MINGFLRISISRLQTDNLLSSLKKWIDNSDIDYQHSMPIFDDNLYFINNWVFYITQKVINI